MKKREFDMRAYIGNISYPVGSVYITTLDDEQDTPWQVFGGTDEDWDHEPLIGRFLIGAGTTRDHGELLKYDIQDTGGSRNAVVVKHTHPFTGTPAVITGGSHQHRIGAGDGGGFGTQIDGQNDIRDHCVTDMTNPAYDGSHTHNFTPEGSVGQSPLGEDGKNKNMPPYYAVNMWVRLQLAPVYVEEYDGELNSENQPQMDPIEVKSDTIYVTIDSLGNKHRWVIRERQWREVF